MSKGLRKGQMVRETRETRIQAAVTIDGSGQAKISTGIGFFDHMLESLARHSAIDMEISAKGDLHIDMHHTMEDVGIVLGQAFREAFGGNYAGIIRFGTGYVPMDESLVRASVDLCSRPYLVWQVDFARDKVGDVDTELFREFFYAFAINAGICLHVTKLYGQNSHHIAESAFKAVARALREASVKDTRLADGEAASTKGQL